MRKTDKDKGGIRYKEYEFMKNLPKGTQKFKELKQIDLQTKAKIAKGMQDPAVDASWRILLEERFVTLHEITKNLYLTSVFGMNREDLTHHGIQFIVNATTILPIIKEYRHRTLRVPVEDDRGADIYPFLDHTADAIHELLTDNKKVVVHCQAGVSRSAALIMGYLIKYERRTLRNAYNLVASKRQVVRPNTTFLHALIKFEKNHLHSASTKIIQVQKNGRIMELPNWLYYDMRSKFEEEFSMLSEQSMNSAKYVNPTQVLIDVDADPEVFNKNREMILGPNPMIKHLTQLDTVPVAPPVQEKVIEKPPVDQSPPPVATHIPSPAHLSTHTPAVPAKKMPAVPAKLPVTTHVTKQLLSSQKKPSELALFPHQRSADKRPKLPSDLAPSAMTPPLSQGVQRSGRKVSAAKLPSDLTPSPASALTPPLSQGVQHAGRKVSVAEESRKRNSSQLNTDSVRSVDS